MFGNWTSKISPLLLQSNVLWFYFVAVRSVNKNQNVVLLGPESQSRLYSLLFIFNKPYLSVAWPTGVQLVFFFCSGVSKLFGAQGSPSPGSLLNLLSPRF